MSANEKHSAVIAIALGGREAHAKLLDGALQAARHHQPVPRLVDVQRAWNPRECLTTKQDIKVK